MYSGPFRKSLTRSKPGSIFKDFFKNDVFTEYSLIFFFWSNVLNVLTFLSEKSKQEKIMIKVFFELKTLDNDLVRRPFNWLYFFIDYTFFILLYLSIW